MNHQELQELLESQEQSISEEVREPEGQTGRIGILTSDPVSRRLLEGLSVQLDLQPDILQADSLQGAVLLNFEIVVADEREAARMRDLLRGLGQGETGNVPALVAIRTRSSFDGTRASQRDMPFEGVLTLPEQPSMVTAQLGVILYAHRAYLRRYRDAMEELQLNRRIFRSVTSGITVARAEPDCPLVYVNPAFEVITGYTMEESLGKNCRFLQGEHRDQPGLTLVREALRLGREVKAIIRNFRKDGSPFWNELSISPIRNHEGTLTHFVGIQQDVTSRVEFEEALRESEKLATAGRLAASIAHEINNPLEAITNLIYLARRAQTQDEAEQHLSMADAELRRVALLTSQSLRFYKQSSAPQAIKPSELLDSVLDVYARRMQSLQIRVEKREHMCDSIVCYESELRQVLSNLIRNSMDAMKTTGGGRLIVRTREASDWDHDQKGVLITIADTGTGISPDVQKRIFEAFYSTKGNSGTGLGLWVTREIVNRHKGSLRVRSCSIPGRSWTVFELFVPYQGLVP
jgi:two-component system, sporulation sensor kinase C